MPDYHLSVGDGLDRLPGSNGERFVELFRHGTLSVVLYAPRGHATGAFVDVLRRRGRE